MARLDTAWTHREITETLNQNEGSFTGGGQKGVVTAPFVIVSLFLRHCLRMPGSWLLRRASPNLPSMRRRYARARARVLAHARGQLPRVPEASQSRFCCRRMCAISTPSLWYQISCKNTSILFGGDNAVLSPRLKSDHSRPSSRTTSSRRMRLSPCLLSPGERGWRWDGGVGESGAPSRGHLLIETSPCSLVSSCFFPSVLSDPSVPSRSCNQDVSF